MTQDNVPAKKRASPRILLVEDDPINVEVTLAILSACAMVVDTAKTVCWPCAGWRRGWPTT